MNTAVQATSASGAWSRRCALACRSSGSKQASRGARNQEDFTVPFHSGSPGNSQSPSSPSTIVVADHTSRFRVSLRAVRAYFRFLAPSLARFRYLTGEHRRGTCFPTWFRRTIAQSTTTIVFLVFFSFDWYQPRIQGCLVAAAPPCSGRRRLTVGEVNGPSPL
jgi:hypothetical protein